MCPVYCESCIVVPEDEVIICSACESPHPGQVPKVCLEFSYFLEEKFTEEYAVQRKMLNTSNCNFDLTIHQPVCFACQLIISSSVVA